IAPRAALRVAEGSSPFATRPRALRARWRASSGVSTPTRPKASFRVLPAEFRYWTTHVRAPDGLARRAKPDRSSSRYSVSRRTGFKASTNRLVSLGKAASAGAGRWSTWRGHSGDTHGGKLGQLPEFPRSRLYWRNCCIQQAKSPSGKLGKTWENVCHCL